MKVTDLPLSSTLGIRAAPPGAAHLLELADTSLVRNHLGTLHAAAQFALAEAASAECLQRRYGEALPDVFAVVRGVEVRYRHPGRGDLLAFGEPDAATRDELIENLQRHGRARAVILIDLKDRAGTLTFHGQFEWFISRLPPHP